MQVQVERQKTLTKPVIAKLGRDRFEIVRPCLEQVVDVDVNVDAIPRLIHRYNHIQERVHYLEPLPDLVDYLSDLPTIVPRTNRDTVLQHACLFRFQKPAQRRHCRGITFPLTEFVRLICEIFNIYQPDLL